MQNSTFSQIGFFEPADPKSAKKYEMQAQGQFRIGELQTALGQLCPSFRYFELNGKGSSMSFELSDVTAEHEVILEIKEVHDRTDRPFAYWIQVDGKPAYYRTYAPCCDGANHFFVRLKGPFNGQDIHITFLSDDDRIIRFSGIYVYCDGLQLAETEKVDSPMLLGLFSPGLSGDEQEDIRRLNECRDTFAPYPVLCGWDIFYIRMTREALHNQLDYILHLSDVTGIPMSFDLNSWWSGTPVGMDGLGGNFRDLDYHQVVYDPVNATGYGVYQLTTPNYWRNLPWLTMNNEHYNRARQERLRDAAEHLKMRIAEYRAAGRELPITVIFTENEPDYWHYGAWHDSADGIVGIEPCAVKAAAKDGVKLDPEKGADKPQRDWMWKNLTDYIIGVGDAIADGIGHDVTVVKDGKYSEPDDLLSEHSYTHATTGESNHPYTEGKHSMWETHVINSLRLGYQGGVTAGDPRPLEYATCYGRLAGVNKEQLKESAYDILPYSYLFGADFQTIFNYKHCVESLKNAPKPQDYANTPVPTLTYNKQLMRYDFDSNGCLTPNEVLIAIDNMCYATARGSLAVRGSDDNPSGSMIFRIHSDTGFTDGLITEWRATVNNGTTDILELGYSPDSFTIREELTGRNQYVGSYITDWSDRIDRGVTDIYLKITMPSGLNATEYNAPERNSVCSLIVHTPRIHNSGHCDGIHFTFEELRRLHRLSERREDARRLMHEFPYDSKLSELFDQGRYQTVYDTLMRRASQKLPADYLVYNNGPLGVYPFEISTDSPVRITVLSAEHPCYRIKVAVRGDKPCHIRISNSDGITATQETDSVWRITVTPDSKPAAELTAEPPVRSLPRRLSGRIVGLYPDSLRFQCQDMDIMFYADFITLPLDDSCRCFISEDGSDVEAEHPREDLPSAVSAVIITDGDKVTEIHAKTGTICGEVVAFTEASIVGEIKHPTVTVSDGKREITATIGSECSLNFTGAEGAGLHITRIGHIGLTVGQRIELCYFTKIDGCPVLRASSISDAPCK